MSNVCSHDSVSFQDPVVVVEEWKFTRILLFAAALAQNRCDGCTVNIMFHFAGKFYSGSF